MRASSGEIKSYGILVASVDNLFKIKNKFGNTKAITLLQTASRLICTTFDHSPVFRVNEDEFIVVLTNDDLKNRKELEEKLASSVKNTANAENPWEQVRLSIGIAICEDTQSSSLSEQLANAENNMLKSRNAIE
jgi:diguanylate cyclase (GGDEF)-like protein